MTYQILNNGCPAQVSVRGENFLNRFNLGVRFLGFAGAQVIGIRPIVEGVQSVANRQEQFGLWAGHAFFLRDFHQPRVLFPSPKDFNFLFARQFLA
jgi:hypothetical protein